MLHYATLPQQAALSIAFCPSVCPLIHARYSDDAVPNPNFKS